jgi:thiol-disulfide isomerase/thioredoxin
MSRAWGTMMRDLFGARVLLAAVSLGWGLVLAPGEGAWASDPLFQAMGVRHPGKEARAPDFKLPTPEGATLALEQFRGKVVFLNFWATWCPPCRVEMPAMERLHKEFKDQGLAMLAVDVKESSNEVARFMKQFRLSFPAVLDADGDVTIRYRVSGLPTTYLIDRSGRVVGAAVGPRNWASPEAMALIRSLLDQQEGQES